ncbi:MAG TPA: response regulator transcription factor [Anaerolineae bacterium]|nr:response regulator transcription factor [Anaerolineae bacterium]
MPTAWIITETNLDLVEAFQTADWEIEVFAPADLVPAGQLRVRDLDVIIFEVGEASFLSRFREICQAQLAPTLAVLPSWTFADVAAEAGANEVMVAPVNPIELLWRARRLTHAAKIIRVGELKIDLSAQTVERNDHVVHLSPLEYRLLSCLAEHLGQPVSHDKILGDVCGCFPERGGTPEQVKSVVKRLRTKIEPTPHHPQYIISIKRIGYQLRSQAQWEAVMREA